MRNIAIIGAGEIGRALGNIFKHEHVELFDSQPGVATHPRNLESIIAGAEYIFLCVPSWAMRDVVMAIKPFVNKKHIVISLAKGIERKTGKTMDVVLRKALPKGGSFGVLGGAMIAEELGTFGAACLAITPGIAQRKIDALFKETSIKIEVSSDLRGVAVLGVLKNIYALGLGMIDGLGLGSNCRGWYVACALREMKDLVVKLGGKAETVTSMAGIADFIATGFSQDSRNYQVGSALAKNNQSTLVSEGVTSIPALIDLIDKSVRMYPILDMLHSVVVKHSHAKTSFKKLLK